jgi:DNA-binding NarL/FixJ family response regulator
MSNEAPISVVIVSDDIVRCEALRLMLRDPQIEVQTTCMSGEESFHTIGALQPQLALLDIRRGQNAENTIALIKHLRATNALTRCLVLAAVDPLQDLLFESLLAGADGCLSQRELEMEALPSKVKRVAEGQTVLSPDIREVVMQRLGRELSHFYQQILARATT